MACATLPMTLAKKNDVYNSQIPNQNDKQHTYNLYRVLPHTYTDKRRDGQRLTNGLVADIMGRLTGTDCQNKWSK